MRLQQNDVEGAVKDLEVVLLKDPTNQIIAGAAIQKLAEMDKVREAEELITKILAAKPSEGMYRMRAILVPRFGRGRKSIVRSEQGNRDAAQGSVVADHAPKSLWIEKMSMPPKPT